MSIRIIAGKYRGSMIEAPSSARPTLSKSRQALFNILESLQINSKFGEFFHDKMVIDCFAGSGALGIEALSRGAAYAYFIDNNQNAISVLRSNLAKINALSSGTVIFSDIMTISLFNNKKNGSQKCDLIFMDPPYCSNFSILKIINHLDKCGWISDKAIFVVETSADIAQYPSMKDDMLSHNFHGLEALKIVTSRKIGNSRFTVIASGL